MQTRNGKTSRLLLSNFDASMNYNHLRALQPWFRTWSASRCRFAAALVRAGDISKRWKLVVVVVVVVVVGRVAATASGYSQSMLDHCILASQTHSTGTYGNNMSINIKLELMKIQEPCCTCYMARLLKQLQYPWIPWASPRGWLGGPTSHDDPNPGITIYIYTHIYIYIYIYIYIRINIYIYIHIIYTYIIIIRICMYIYMCVNIYYIIDNITIYI